MTIKYYDADPRTPEQRLHDEALYELAEAGKLHPSFRPPKPRKRAKRKRRTGARR